MPDIEMPDGVVVSFPNDMEPQEIQNFIFERFPSTNPANKGNEFTRGFKRNLETTPALVTEGLVGVGKGLLNDLANFVGKDDFLSPDENLRKYQQKVDEAYRKFPTKVPSFTDISTESVPEFLSDTGAFIASTAGEQVVQLGIALGTGGVAGLATKTGVQALAKRGGQEITEAQANKFIKRGVIAGTLAGSASQNIPETYFNLLDQGEDAATQSILFGALKSGLDILPQIQILKKLGFGDDASDIVANGLLKRIAVEGGKAGVQEGLTESAQEGVDLIAEQFILENKELFTPENITRLIDSGLKGAIGGATFGGAAAPFMQGSEGTSFNYSNLSDKKKRQIDQRFEEEIVGDSPTVKNVETIQEASAGDSVRITDPTLIEPTYVAPETLEIAKELGIETESINTISLKDFENSQNTLLNLDNVTQLNDVYTPLSQMDVPNVTEQLTQRLEQIQNNERQDNNFILGDGEIVIGAPTNEEATIMNPLQKLKVYNPEVLEETTQPKVQPTPPVQQAREKDIRLPKGLQNAKPKYNTSKLNFNSDLEKALYIVGNREQKSKADNKYYTWLTDTVGLSDAEIAKYSRDVRDTIKDIAQRNPRIEEITVPVLERTPDTNFQRLNLPYNGNLRDDYVVPKVIANNLKAIELSPQARQKNKQVIKQIKRIGREVVGPKTDVRVFDSLTDFNNNPVAGAQNMNLIAVALSETNQAKVQETVYHEAYHALEEMGAFTPQEIQIIDNNTDQLFDYMNQDEYLRTQDFDVFMASPEGRAELRANAFGKYATQPDNTQGLVPRFKKFFRKAKNLLTKTGNALKGLGFNSMEDIFSSVKDGSRAIDVLDDINYTNRMTRFQKIGDAYREQTNIIRQDADPEQYIRDARIETNQKKSLGLLGAGYLRFIRSMSDAGSSDRLGPFLGELFDVFRRRDANSSVLMSKYIGILGDFTTTNKGIRHRIHDLTDFMRSTGQKAALDEQGRLIFERDGQMVRINDVDISRQYMALQDSYREVLNDYEGGVKRAAFKKFGPEVLVDENFNLKTVQAAKAAVIDNEKLFNDLEKLEETLIEFNNMRATDFIPHMRFGKWGITVRDKETGEQVAFYTVEKGRYRRDYNKYQLQEVSDTLKEKYSDTTKFEVIGSSGTITDFSIEKLSPFRLTHNEIKNNVDPRFVNIELLSSLLQNKDLDVEAYEQLRDEIYNDILTKGFTRRFTESKGIDGYSKDWNRVQHAYLSGAARYIAGIESQKEIEVFRQEANKLKDDAIRQRALSYLDYVNSPQEDLIALRSFNFLWTMGGNLSTAALQIMTLPTTTLGAMSQYSPNVLKNMGLIGKWMALGTKEFGSSSIITLLSHEGVAQMDFNNPEKLQRLIEKGKITPQMAKVMEDLYSEGKIRGLLTEEQVGSRQFETRSLSGGFREGLSTTANFLGVPISVMEQLTRFATTMATYEMLLTDPKAQQRARKVLAKDQRFQAQLRNDPTKSFAEHVAGFTMDEAHAVFGKIGRPEFMRSYGGALFFPFMTYPQQALEFLFRTLGGRGRGVDGLRGGAVTVGALFMLSGLLGLPGAELLKELGEELEKQVTGSEEDFDLLIRSKIYDAYGDTRFAKFVTQGLGRSYLGLDTARRIGLPIPGQDLILTFLGVRGDATDLFGVSGSFLTGIADAWNEYNNDSSAVKIASSMLPVAAANLTKAIQFSTEGVSTRRGVQLLTPEEVTAKTIAARAFGVTSDQIATKREEQYLSRLLGTKHTTAIERYRTKAKKKMTEIRRAQKDNKAMEAKKLWKEYREILQDLIEYGKINDIPLSMSAFNRSVADAAQQRIDPTIRPKDIRKQGRKELNHLQEVLGTK